MKLFLTLISSLATALSSNLWNGIPGVYNIHKTKDVKIIPEGHISLELSKSTQFPLYCEASDANQLIFLNKGQKMNSTKINATTILAYFPPTVVGESAVECLFENDIEGGMKLDVYVGFEPQDVKDFRCISENFQSFDCLWKENPENPIKTIYSLDYYVNTTMSIKTCCGSIEKKNQHSQDFVCSFKQLYGAVCINYDEELLINTVIQFDLSGEILVKDFGGKDGSHFYRWKSVKKFWNFSLDHNSLVRPSVPENLSVRHLNSTTTAVSFNVSKILRDFIRHQTLEYQVEFCYQETCTFQCSGLITKYGPTTAIVSGLSPWTEYRIRVRIRPQSAKHSRYWSEYGVIHSRTPPQAPTETPVIHPSSFQFIPDLKDSGQGPRVRIHWLPIHPTGYNGPGFGYRVQASSENKMSTHHQQQEGFFELTNINLDAPATVLISAENDVGVTKASEIVVPSWESVQDIMPTNVKNTVFENESEIELRWSPPVGEESIDSYTIFWCSETLKPGCPYLCDGQLSWKIIIPEQNTYKFNVSHPGPIGLAANARSVSSGVVWPTWIHCPGEVFWLKRYPWIIIVPLFSVLALFVGVVGCWRVGIWYRNKLAFFDKLGGDLGDFVIPGFQTDDDMKNKDARNMGLDIGRHQDDLYSISNKLESSLMPSQSDTDVTNDQELSNLVNQIHLKGSTSITESTSYSKVNRLENNRIGLVDEKPQIIPTKILDEDVTLIKTKEDYISNGFVSHISSDIAPIPSKDAYISVSSISRRSSIDVASTQTKTENCISNDSSDIRGKQIKDAYISVSSISRRSSIDVSSTQPKIDSCISNNSTSQIPSNLRTKLTQDAYISIGSISRRSSIDVASTQPKINSCISNDSISHESSSDLRTKLIRDAYISIDSISRRSSINDQQLKNEPYISIDSISSLLSTNITPKQPNNEAYISIDCISNKLSKEVAPKHSKNESYLSIGSVSQSSSDIPSENNYTLISSIRKNTSTDAVPIKSKNEGYISIYSVSRRSPVGSEISKLHTKARNYILPETILECHTFADQKNNENSIILRNDSLLSKPIKWNSYIPISNIKQVSPSCLSLLSKDSGVSAKDSCPCTSSSFCLCELPKDLSSFADSRVSADISTSEGVDETVSELLSPTSPGCKLLINNGYSKVGFSDPKQDMSVTTLIPAAETASQGYSKVAFKSEGKPS